MQNVISGDSQNVNEQSSVQVFNASFPIKEKRKGFIVLAELESLFNRFDKNQYEILKTDIQKNGINTPIVVIKVGDDKIVVDGHVRLRIADETKLDSIPEIELVETFESIEEAKIWIVRNQCQRRNLSKNQRVRLAYSLKDSIAALARKNLSLAAVNGSVETAIDTLTEIAKIAGVGRTTIAKYQFVFDKASDETKHKMLEGDISINYAYDEAKVNELDVQVIESKETIVLKQNYYQIRNFFDGKKKLKSGELDCIVIVTKGRESQVADTDVKTGLLVSD